ncbi:MAG TPA: ABC transporter permease [Glycomyces sp.]|nr:ABC transporter permease [Glycomyces sp.]
MLGPSLSMARRQIGGLVAVACAVFGGAAMVTASAVVGETGLTSHLPPDRLAAADLLVSARQSHHVPEDVDPPLSERVTVPADLAETIADVPGVAAAVADVAFPAAVTALGEPGEGHGWASAALAGPDLAGEPPAGPGEVVLDAELAAAAGLAAGDRTELTTLEGTAEYLVTGVVDAPGAGAYFAEATAAALTGRDDGAADLIAVAVEPGASVAAVVAEVEAAAGGLTVTAGEARGDVEALAGSAARSELVAISGSLAGTLMILVGCIVAGALSVSVANQRRDLALLRAVGATPRQVRRLVAGQASAVAAIALVPGVAVGYLMAEGFAGVLAGAGMLPEALPVARSPFGAIAAAVLMLATVQLAARGAAMRASRMPATEAATEAVAESRVEPRSPSRARTAAGVLLFAAALAQSLVPLVARGEAALASTAVGTLLAIAGLALAGPALVRAVTGRAARRLSDRASASTWLAVGNSRAYALRTAGSVTVLALAVGLTYTQVYAQTTVERAAEGELEEGMIAAATITGSTGGVAEADLAGLAERPGVAAVVPMASTEVLRRHEVLGDAEIEPHAMLAFGEGAEQVVDPGVEAGDLADLRGETVAVAASWGVDVGERVDLVLADGTEVRPTVVAVYGRGLGFGGVIAAADLLVAHGGPRLFDAVLVAGDAGAAAAWAAGRPGLEAEAGAAALTAGAGASPDRWINLLVTVALVGYVLLGVGNSLVASTARRRGEFAALRIVGATPRQVLAMVRRESVLLAAVAVGAGMAVALVPLSLLGLGLMGRPWPQGPLWLIPAAAAVAAAIAYAATVGPTRRALRQAPAAVLASAD